MTRDIDPIQLGIEIAPWMHPLAPKRAGYRCLSLDVFPTDMLHQIAAADPNIPSEAIADIEEVDIVGTADQLAEHLASRGLLGRLDYVISSHNFEHLPNPVRFLQGCEKALKDNGLLVMAIPDYRACFDYFRPVSTTSDIISAFFKERVAPTVEQSFMQNSRHCRYSRPDGHLEGSFSLEADARRINPLPGLRDAFEHWRASAADDEGGRYQDTHCWAFSPSSFALVLHDLAHLGLSTLHLEDVSETNGNEFYVRLRKAVAPPESDHLFYARRTELMHATKDEAAENTRLVQALRLQLAELRKNAGSPSDAIAA